MFRQAFSSSSLALQCLRTFHRYAPLSAVEVKMPSLSPTMTSGVVMEWVVKEGEEVGAGDVLCQIQTDKAVVALDIDDDGTLAKILVPANSPEVPVGTPIAVLAESGEDWKTVASSVPSTSTTPAPSATQQPATATSTSTPSTTTTTTTDRSTAMLGPAVRLLLMQHNLSPSNIPHTGPHGSLLKSDVLSYVQSGGKVKKEVPKKQAEKPAPKSPTPIPTPVPSLAEPTEGSGYTDIPISNMRRTIAKRLSLSKSTIPHGYASIDMSISTVLDMRKGLKADGVLVSINDFIVKASAAALKGVPEVNVELSPDGGSLRYKSEVDICVAVATEAGLITPIVPSAHTLTVSQIANTVRELAQKAKENKLQLHEFQGGSFTISNLGMFGISEFSAIINPPQCAILAVGGSVPTLVDGNSDPRMTVTLCFDNRAIEDVAACRFLDLFRQYMEDPETMLLGPSLALQQHSYS